MKNLILYIVTIVISLFIGSLFTYIFMTKKQMDSLFIPAVTSKQSTPNLNQTPSDNSANPSDSKNTAISADTQTDNQGTVTNLEGADLENKTFNINQYSEAQAKNLIKDMPDYALSQYVNKFIATDAQEQIEDKRRFAERAIEELYKPNSSEQLLGKATVSFGYNMPDINADTSRVTKFAKIYAHIDTHGELPANQYVFIKWVNNQTGQVLLFEKKNISSNSQQNWVSFVPTDGWQTGSYDVRFYQFTSELKPIAQTTYEIFEVIDEKP